MEEASTSPPQQPLPPPAPTPDRTFPMLCHLTAFSGFVVPLGNIWGPLVVWLIKKDENPDVDAHGKESLNFQISITIYSIVFFILSFLLIGLPFLIAAGVFWFIVVIVASVRASAGDFYRYPLTIRFIN
ncbi:MAG: DUF4870 domain-containing protein [Actinobacteria bacterium]|nr:DUF4870 domain-containing protein [Actinomycetota bacterium]